MCYLIQGGRAEADIELQAHTSNQTSCSVAIDYRVVAPVRPPRVCQGGGGGGGICGDTRVQEGSCGDITTGARITEMLSVKP